MKKNERKLLSSGLILIGVFVLWTILIRAIDVQPIGQNGTDIGFASLNTWFHQLTGVHMPIYIITDWLGLVPVFICIIFGCFGMVQLIRRKSLFKVDADIIMLGFYYTIVILGYLIFEVIPINYRPILIEGLMEASYPSSTTLLVLCVMPTLSFQTHRRVSNLKICHVIDVLTILFSLFMIVSRTVAGVHWLTDIVGSVILSTGLYLTYLGCVALTDKKRNLESR